MRTRKSVPINVADGGECRCLKAGYFKMGWTNFTREILGYEDGFTATAILEVEDEEDGDKHGGRDM